MLRFHNRGELWGSYFGVRSAFEFPFEEDKPTKGGPQQYSGRTTVGNGYGRRGNRLQAPSQTQINCGDDRSDENERILFHGCYFLRFFDFICDALLS